MDLLQTHGSYHKHRQVIPEHKNVLSLMNILH